MIRTRAVAIATATVLSLVATGCSHSGTGAGLIPQEPSALTSTTIPNATRTLSTTSTSTVTQTGQITSVTSGRITIKAGSPYGYVPVYYSSTTSMSGPLTVGYYASVTGTGSMSGPITATKITTSSSSSITTAATTTSTTTQTGKITSVTSSQITINAGSPYGYVPVYYSSSTSISGPLTVGYYATVSGTGSMSGPITATSISTSSTATSSTSTTATTTQSGNITAVTSGRITLYAGSQYGYVPVYYSSTTSISGPLTVGYYATVKGTGSMSGPITASSISTSSSATSPTPTPAPSTSTAMKHLITSD